MTRACAGSTVLPGAIGQTAIALPFAPQGCIWWLHYIANGVEHTVLQNTQPHLTALGWVTPTYSWSHGWRVEENVGTMIAKRYSLAGAGAGYVIPNGAGNAATYGGVVSLTPTGLSVNQTAAAAATTLFGYVAFTGLAGVKAGVFSLAAGTGATAVTGVGFQPDALLLGTGWHPLAGYSGTRAESIGVCDAGTTYGLHARYTDNTAAAAARSEAQVSAVLHRHTTAGVAELDASLTSLDADGFTLSRDVNTLGVANDAYYLALKGDVRVETIGSVGTGSRADLAGLGTPQAGLLLSGFRLSGLVDGFSSSARMGLGVFDSGGEQAAATVHAPNASDPSWVSIAYSRQAAMSTISSTGDATIPSRGRVIVRRDTFTVDNTAGTAGTGDYGALLIGTDRFVRGDMVGS